MEADQKAPDSAAQAFNELQAEVAQVLRAMSAIERAVVDKTVPDYSRDLAGILKGLADVRGRLEAVEAQPAVQMTPAQVQYQIQIGVERATAAREKDLDKAGAELSKAINAMSAVVETGQTRAAQRNALWNVGIIACVVGLLLGPFLWHQTIKRLPESWQVAERLATGLLDRLTWEEAGYRLIISADPDQWNRLVAGHGYVERYGESLAACEEKAAKSGKETACKLTVAPPEKPE